MDELLSEKEQIEQMRDWWRENGTYVVAGLVLGVGAVFGFNTWQDSKEQVRVDASTRFEDLADEVAENRLERAEVVAGDLYSEFGETVYADQAGLAMARLYMDQGRDQDAAETLNTLITDGNNEQLKMVARLRLAKVYLYQNKAQEVIDLLSGYEETGFAARYSEAIGDAHYELGNYTEAEAAWQLALTKDESNQIIDTNLVIMKIGDLPSGDMAAEAGADSAPVESDAEPIEPADGSASEPDEEPVE